jgi:hypothetical protein
MSWQFSLRGLEGEAVKCVTDGWDVAALEDIRSALPGKLLKRRNVT